MERFPELTKIRDVQKRGLEPRVFAQKRPISDPREFTPNRHKQSRKELEIHLEGFRRRFREFGAISRTYQNPPCSKAWAIAQGFCSKTANFRPLRIHPKSTQTVPQEVRNPFRGVLEAFQKVGSDFQNLPKSTLFKSVGYAQGFCSKTANFRPSRIHPKSTQTVPQEVRNPFRGVLEAFQRVWSDFQNLPKSAMFKSMGYSPGFLLKNGQFPTLANTPQIDTIFPQEVRNPFRGVLEAFQRVWSYFQNFPKSDMFKSMGYSPGFLLKNGQFQTLANSPQIDTNSPARS